MVTDPFSRPWLLAVLVGALLSGVPFEARAQFGALISPGPLSKAHADLEGLSKCQSCHERGRQVSAPRCLSCHKPVAARIAARTGVHRNVKDDCVSCHVEHAGIDAELRPFDQRAFKHDTDTTFPLTGRHAAVASKCAACHKGRSFLEATSTCASCHTDVHKGSLSQSCERCHSVDVEFKRAKSTFDHGVTRFALTGAHRTATCASCHRGDTYKVASFGTCSGCHQSPHAPASVQGTCASCHATTSWVTSRFNHTATKFPLLGQHIAATCASCHKTSATRTKPAAGTCATCHADPHKGEFKTDCASCHTEKGFAGGTFDHAKTTLPLDGGHAKVACQNCHKTTRGGPVARASVDFRGAAARCVSCHSDPHRAELGTACETCHSAATFRVRTFAHTSAPAFFSGRHQPLTCEQCHSPGPAPSTSVPRVTLAASRFKATTTACASCHPDVHRGQVGTACERCHTVAATGFVADAFSHDATPFRLTGAHTPLACRACHAPRPGAPAAELALAGVSATCVTCHDDIHLGQLARTCETCHDTRAFALATYAHKNAPRGFFVGPHVKAGCEACHKTSTRAFPSGRGTATVFKVGNECVRCHEDVHRGSLGGNCGSCHKLAPLAAAHRPDVPRWTADRPRLAGGLES